MHVIDVDIDILIKNTMFYTVLATYMERGRLLVKAVLYIIAILVFQHYCLGIKSLKSH